MREIDFDNPKPPAEPDPKDLVVVTQSYPAPVETHLSPLDVAPEVFRAGLDRRRANHKALVDWVRKALVENVDYGKIHVVKKSECPKGKWCTIPGHFSKDSLFKPGAEKIDAMLGVTPRFPTIKDYEQAAVSGVAIETIILRCELIDSHGTVVAEGVGSRSVAKEYGDINKAFKMAEKSGQIDATLRLAGLSEVFTQDVEDMSVEAEIVPSKAPESPSGPTSGDSAPLYGQPPLSEAMADAKASREKAGKDLPPETRTKEHERNRGRGVDYSHMRVQGELCECGSTVVRRIIKSGKDKGLPLKQCELALQNFMGEASVAKQWSVVADMRHVWQVERA